jgi:hypothetical protein
MCRVQGILEQTMYYINKDSLLIEGIHETFFCGMIEPMHYGRCVINSMDLRNFQHCTYEAWSYQVKLDHLGLRKIEAPKGCEKILWNPCMPKWTLYRTINHMEIAYELGIEGVKWFPYDILNSKYPHSVTYLLHVLHLH